jgi:hypothetical protein
MLLLLGSLLDAGATEEVSQERSFESRRVYLKRGKRILLFNNVAEADNYEEAERIANEAIAKAQSKRAVKRLQAKVIQVAPPVETIDTGALIDLLSAYQINLPQLMAEQDYSQLAEIYLRLREQQEEEDLEVLLLA